MKKLALGLIIAVCSLNTFAQKISVVSATEEQWSGGAVGRHGAKYNIVLKVPKGKIILDSVYINNIGYSLPDNKNMAIDSVKHTYSISIGEAHWGRPDPVTNTYKNEEASKTAVRIFKGKALVVYTYKKKKCFYIVREMTSLKPKMYP
jgi:hypothetical protein